MALYKKGIIKSLYIGASQSFYTVAPRGFLKPLYTWNIMRSPCALQSPWRLHKVSISEATYMLHKAFNLVGIYEKNTYFSQTRNSQVIIDVKEQIWLSNVIYL